MNRQGVTLLEILISAVLLVLVCAGLASVFLAGKKIIGHDRSQLTALELTKYFTSAMDMQVKSSSTAPLGDTTTCLYNPALCSPTTITLDRTYTSTVTSEAGFLPGLRRVQVTISWQD